MRTISTVELVCNIKAGRVGYVLPMIAEKANACWLRLPGSEKSVRSKKDLLQEGINHTVTHVAVRFDIARAPELNHFRKQYVPDQISKKVKFTTFLNVALDNYYADVIRAAYTEKRLAAHGLFSADTTKVVVAGRTISLIDKIKLTRKTRFDQELSIINRIDAERSFVKAYTNASPMLRRYMIKWLLQPKVSRNKTGVEFNNAKREFRKVAKPILSNEMCETIQNDYLCRATIADRVVTSFHTHKKSTSQLFIHTEEFQLAPILSRQRIEQVIPVIG